MYLPLNIKPNFWRDFMDNLDVLVSGYFRLGWLIRFISHSVISGFTTSSAIVIGLSQAKYFLGYDIERSSKIIPLVKSIITGADKVCNRFEIWIIQWSFFCRCDYLANFLVKLQFVVLAYLLFTKWFRKLKELGYSLFDGRHC